MSNTNLEGFRLTVRHFFYVAVVLCLMSVLYAWFRGSNSSPAIAAGCTFLGILLPIYQLSNHESVHGKGWGELDKNSRMSVVFTTLGIIFTAVGYYVGLPALFQ